MGFVKYKTLKLKYGANRVLFLTFGPWVIQFGLTTSYYRWAGWTFAFAKERYPVKPILEYLVNNHPPLSVYEYTTPEFERLEWDKSPWTTAEEIAAGKQAAAFHKKKKRGKT